MTAIEPTRIGDFLKRIRRSVDIEDQVEYQLVTIKMHHKGVVPRTKKLGSSIGTKKMYRVKTGDFILSGIDARNGAFGIVPKELNGAVVTNDFWYFEVDESVIDKHLFLELTATTWFDEICRLGSDGTTQRIRLQKDKFFSQEIPLPTIGNQKQLLKRLLSFKKKSTSLQAEITEQQTMLKKLRQSILQDAIQGKLTADWRKAHPATEPATDLLQRIQAEKQTLLTTKKIRKQKTLPPINPKEIPFEIPEGWEWCRYGDICEYITSGSRGWQKYYANEGALFIRAQNIKTDELVLNDKAYVKLPPKVEGKRAFVQLGDILVTITGGNVGKTALVKEQPEEAYISQHIALTRLMEASSAQYLFLNFISDAGVRGQLMKFVKGAKPGLTLENIQNLHVPLPPLAEQQAIVAQITTLFEMVGELEQQTTRSRTDAASLMASVLAAAFSS